MSDRSRVAGVAVRCCLSGAGVLCLGALAQGAAFGLPQGTITYAALRVDFAAMTAQRGFFGVDVNHAVLFDPLSGTPSNDVSDQMFGTMGSPALVDQGALGTGFVDAAIDPSFFPVIEAGFVGISATFTDTADGLFAIDFVGLVIHRFGMPVQEVFYSPGGNNGFGIGLADFANLPAPLDTGPLGVTHTGFDEIVTGKSMRAIVIVPAPASGAAGTLGLFVLAARRRRGGNR